jgi:hypothetical protein
MSIERRHWLTALALAAAMVLILLWMGRPAICTCGEVKLWTGAVQSADNSQHIADWYTPSHIIHGFLFYMLGWLFLRQRPTGERFIGAVAIEAGGSCWRTASTSSTATARGPSHSAITATAC